MNTNEFNQWIDKVSGEASAYVPDIESLTQMGNALFNTPPLSRSTEPPALTVPGAEVSHSRPATGSSYPSTIPLPCEAELKALFTPNQYRAPAHISLSDSDHSGHPPWESSFYFLDEGIAPGRMTGQHKFLLPIPPSISMRSGVISPFYRNTSMGIPWSGWTMRQRHRNLRQSSIG